MRVYELQSRWGRPSEKESITKTNQILAAACDLFVEFGYRAVTMRMVAEKAQVSTRTLYNRYADKLTLFTACIDTGAAAFPRLDVAPRVWDEQAKLFVAMALSECRLQTTTAKQKAGRSSRGSVRSYLPLRDWFPWGRLITRYRFAPPAIVIDAAQ